MQPIEYEDSGNYFRFTAPARLDKAIHTLEGIVRGITADNRVSDKELATLTRWIAMHREFLGHHPFNEIVPRLNFIIDNRIVDEEAVADILWLCEKFTAENFYDQVTSDMQRLQGLLHGILADNVITKDELLGLEAWMEEREHLKKCWPYDEIESLIIAVLKDGVIDDQEHEMLRAFFSDFCHGRSGKVIDPNFIDSGKSLSGVCAMCPEIEFEEKTFCFTGSSGIHSRKELAAMVESLGGRHTNNVTKKVDYLVVCSDGNQCWAYACYGRKVEKAIEMRKNGSNIMLIHELDFRDSIPE